MPLPLIVLLLCGVFLEACTSRQQRVGGWYWYCDEYEDDKKISTKEGD